MYQPSTLEKLDENSLKEYWASLALRYAKNIGVRSATKLMQYYGSALNAINHIDFWEDNKLNSKKDGIYSASWREQALEEWEEANNTNSNIILWTDYRYPAQLKQIIDAPILFYAKGNCELLLNICIAVVGSRDFTVEGAKTAREISYQLSKSGITIVSGLAKGIDRNAHIGAIKDIGSTIGVLGAGVEVIYPKENTDIYSAVEEYGLIISEFTPHTKPDARNFPIRNRLISGLSLGVLVIEASLKSGSLITARLALEQNKNVYAIPGAYSSKHSEGCQKLIREGAVSVFSYEDILLDLPNFKTLQEINIKQLSPAPQVLIENQSQKLRVLLTPPDVKNNNILKTPKTASQKLKAVDHNFAPNSPEEQIINCLKNKVELSIDAIIEQTSLPSSKVNSILTILEVKKVVQKLAGSNFKLQ